MRRDINPILTNRAIRILSGFVLLIIPLFLMRFSYFWYLISFLIFALVFFSHSCYKISIVKGIDKIERKDKYFMKGFREAHSWSYLIRLLRDVVCALLLPVMLFLTSLADVVALAVLVPLTLLATTLLSRFTPFIMQYENYRTESRRLAVISIVSSVLYPIIWVGLYKSLGSYHIFGTLENLENHRLTRLIGILVDFMNFLPELLMECNAMWIMVLCFCNGGVMLYGLYRYFQSFLLKPEDIFPFIACLEADS